MLLNFNYASKRLAVSCLSEIVLIEVPRILGSSDGVHLQAHPDFIKDLIFLFFTNKTFIIVICFITNFCLQSGGGGINLVFMPIKLRNHLLIFLTHNSSDFFSNN